MQIITIVDDIRITKWSVDLENLCVFVNFEYLTDQDTVWKEDYAVFWVTIPSAPIDSFGNPIEPHNWYQLPPEYVQTLASITSNARLALLPLVS